MDQFGIREMSFIGYITMEEVWWWIPQVDIMQVEIDYREDQ
jgi:hypothetical protein